MEKRKINLKEYQELFDAIYKNNFELAKILLEDGEVDVNIKDDYGDTPLMFVNRRQYKMKKRL